MLIATRDPRGLADHGRMTVLHTITSVLERTHDEVVVCFCGSAAAVAEGSGSGVRYVPLEVSPLWRVVHALRQLVLGPRSLNMAAGLCGRQVRMVVDLFEGEGRWPDLFVLDGVRSLAMLPAARGAAVHVDLDDLMSERYSSWAGLPFRRLPYDLRGTRPASPVNRVGRALRGLVPLVMRREARVAEAVELRVCRTAASVSVVSVAEADRLATRAGREVAALPMAMPLPGGTSPRPSSPRYDAVFLGCPTFLPNLAALLWLGEQVMPEFERLAGRPLRVAVAGSATPTVTAWIRERGLIPLGFVEDLAALFSECAVALAPQVVGGGVKTKVLEYGSHAMPIIGTPQAFEGVSHHFDHADRPWLEGRTEAEIAAHIVRLLDNPEEANQLGQRVRQLVEAEYAEPVIAEAWGRTLLSVKARAGSAR